MKLFSERFKDFFNSLNESQQESVIREYNDANCYCGVFDMECFNEVMSGKSPMEIVSRCRAFDFNPSHRYFRCDANGCFESSDDICAWVDLDDMARWYKDYDYILERINTKEYEMHIEGWEEDKDEE